MRRFAVLSEFDAECVITPDAVAGEVYHVERTAAGGANLTTVARFFSWHHQFTEGFQAHWRVDCFVKKHPLSPMPKILGAALGEALIREGICSEPMWVSWHRSEEIAGKAFGEVFDFD
jgi:hypothetical protein